MAETGFWNSGHGHVFPRTDGVRARCGGPGMCAECSGDLVRKNAELASTLPPTAAEPSEQQIMANLERGVDIVKTAAAHVGITERQASNFLRTMAACGMEMLVKIPEAGGIAPLVEYPLEPSEPKADGFDVWWAKHEGDGKDAYDYARNAYQAGEQSGVRKGMQRALEVCKNERLDCHEKMMATGATSELEAEDAGYSSAINNCETAITAELAKEQQ